MGKQRSSQCPLPKHPVPSTRRSSQQGVAMSLEKRPPRELLDQIGISGKDVVKIIKEWHWDIEEPHGLQQQNLYHLPGSMAKGDEAQQNVDFFVGEGELYAFILKQGGVRYLLPDESEVSDIEPILPSTLSKALKPSRPLEEIEACTMEAEDGLLSDNVMDEQRTWKRRKRLSTARSDAVEKTPQSFDPRKKSSSVDTSRQANLGVESRAKSKQAAFGSLSQQAEFHEYEASWKEKGWRAQLLQDIDVHLLRSVAAVDRSQRAVKNIEERQKVCSRPLLGAGPHVQDVADMLQEIDRLLYSIRASQDDITSMIESIIAEAERVARPDRIDSMGRIGIPGFVSTGAGTLMLMRDIERYLLLVVAAVRRYQRTRMACSGEKGAYTSSDSAGRAVKRKTLRALQLSIEESKWELQELATTLAAEARIVYLDHAQLETEQSTPHEAS